MNEIMQQTAAPTTQTLPINLRPDICYFGTIQDRGQNKNFGILQDDRRRHMYILGKTGMGKSTLLENMILQDIYNGHGVCFMDPHGDSAEYILDHIPENRIHDVVYFNPADTDYPLAFNMLEAKRGEEPFLITSGMMAIFNRIWAGMWSARMEYILNNTILALLETPGNTLLGVVRMLTDKEFRDEIIRNVQDPLVKNFWLKEFASFNDKYRTEAIAPVLNKIGQFFSTDLIRNILGQPVSTIDFRDIMDHKKILIVNLSKGKLGEDNSSLLGSFIVTKIQLAAMSRVDIPEEARNDFYVYVDEFQNFTTDSFATILSEARKYRLSLILAHQYIAQLTESENEKVRNAVFGNVGSMLCFRVGSDDGQVLEKEFEPVFTSQQLINLNKFQIALRMPIDGKPTYPFLANTMSPIFDSTPSMADRVIESSRNQYGKFKETVKKEIHDWLSQEYPQIPQKQHSNQPSRDPKPIYNRQNQGQSRTLRGELDNVTKTFDFGSEKKKQDKQKRKKFNPFLQPTRDDRYSSSDSKNVSSAKNTVPDPNISSLQAKLNKLKSLD